MSWKSAQSALQEAGLSKKEAISLTTVRRCLKDLEQLKACGGPVTSQDEVNRLVSDANLSEVEKQNRLFTEVRYARDTSLSLPKASPLFSLMYKYKKLPVETYGKNLRVYLRKITSSSATTWADFDGAVFMLKNSI